MVLYVLCPPLTIIYEVSTLASINLPFIKISGKRLGYLQSLINKKRVQLNLI
jgi:hypothetical protein